MKTNLLFSFAVIAFLGISNAASAQSAQPAQPAQSAQNGKFDQTHPRRAEVNQRLANQNKRINKDVKDGDMSKAKAARLKNNDHKIRQEERDMASQDHGHITKQEQKTLNQQENKNSQKIRN